MIMTLEDEDHNQGFVSLDDKRSRHFQRENLGDGLYWISSMPTETKQVPSALFQHK